MSINRITKAEMETAFNICNKHEFKETQTVKTGYEMLDRRRGGLMRGETYVLAGRPAMGKTSFVLNLVKNIAIAQNKPVIYFLGRHNKFMIQSNLLTIVSADGDSNIRSRDYIKNEVNVNKVVDAPIYYCEKRVFTKADVLEDILKERICPALIVFDEIECDGFSYKEYKGIAEALNCPVIITASVSRDVETREDHRPRTCDITDQNLAKGSDNILILYRDAYYDYLSDKGNLAELYFARAGYPGSQLTDFIWNPDNLTYSEYKDNMDFDWKPDTSNANNGFDWKTEVSSIKDAELVNDAIEYAKRNEYINIPMLREKYEIGFNKASWLLDILIKCDAIYEKPTEAYFVKRQI